MFSLTFLIYNKKLSQSNLQQQQHYLRSRFCDQEFPNFRNDLTSSEKDLLLFALIKQLQPQTIATEKKGQNKIQFANG